MRGTLSFPFSFPRLSPSFPFCSQGHHDEGLRGVLQQDWVRRAFRRIIIYKCITRLGLATTSVCLSVSLSLLAEHCFFRKRCHCCGWIVRTLFFFLFISSPPLLFVFSAFFSYFLPLACGWYFRSLLNKIVHCYKWNFFKITLFTNVLRLFSNERLLYSVDDFLLHGNFSKLHWQFLTVYTVRVSSKLNFPHWFPDWNGSFSC